MHKFIRISEAYSSTQIKSISSNNKIISKSISLHKMLIAFYRILNSSSVFDYGALKIFSNTSYIGFNCMFLPIRHASLNYTTRKNTLFFALNTTAILIIWQWGLNFGFYFGNISVNAIIAAIRSLSARLYWDFVIFFSKLLVRPYFITNFKI